MCIDKKGVGFNRQKLAVVALYMYRNIFFDIRLRKIKHLMTVYYIAFKLSLNLQLPKWPRHKRK